MATDKILRQRIDTKAILLVLFGLAAGLSADEITVLPLKSPPVATKTLSFPADQRMGNLFLEPESGPGWNPEHVGLSGQWDSPIAAQGEVRVPEDRNVKLFVVLALSASEKASFERQNPLAYQKTIADRVGKDPEDLSGLSELGPNDLFWLSVCTEYYRRTGANPGIFEPIRRLTGLQILSLQSAGVTDEGLEHLRPLRSLRALELTQFSLGTRALSVLKDLPALEYLDLNTGITDTGLKQVAQVSSLKWLRLVDGNIWGPGLAELAHLPRLERLCILQGRGQLFDRHIKYLEGLTQLKSLTFWSSGCDNLTDAGLASIGKLTSLEELYLIKTSPRFTPAGLAHLKNLKNLKKVHFAQTWGGSAGAQYGDEVVRQLADMPHLESLEGIAYLSAEGMKTLATLRNLKSLGVALKNRRQGYLGPTGLSHLTGINSLEELQISSEDPLSDTDLASLESLSDLRDLLIMCPVTEQGLACIGKLKKLEHLQLFLRTVSRKGLNYLNGLSNLQMLNVGARDGAAETATTDELTLDLSGLQKMKELYYLSGPPLHDDDLAFLKHLPMLEELMIQSDSDSHLTGESLHYLRDLSELNRLWISGLPNCTGEELANLNGLPKLRDLTISGNITDTALASLKGDSSLWSLHVNTDNPIRKETVTDLATSHPGIEYIHINELPKIQTRPTPEKQTQPAPKKRSSSRDRRR